MQRLAAALPFVFLGKLKPVVRLTRGELLAALDGAPSLLNDGYLHIERAIELVRHFQLPTSAAIVDVGAAAGDTALRFSAAFPRSPVHCFEPLPDAFRQLQAIAKDCPQIIPKNVGLAASAGRGTMFLTRRTTSSSLMRPVDDIQDSYLADNICTDREQSVMLSTLDEELAEVNQINILKLDVQGYELEVLKGGADSVQRTTIVLVEMQNHEIYQTAPRYYEVDAFLRQVGFRLFSMTPSIVRNRKMYEWDAIYVNRQVAERFDT